MASISSDTNPSQDANVSSSSASPQLPNGDVLPNVEPPSAAFLLQLFVIPLVIVTLIVVIWMLFSWVAHIGTNPKSIVREIGAMNEPAWQKAITLANFLNDSRHENLKSDPEFCDSIVQLVERDLETPIRDSTRDAKRIKLRMYLCRALGEFKIDRGLPVLIKASTTERTIHELNGRLAALEALSIAIRNVGPVALRERKELVDALLECSRASDENVEPLPGQSPDFRPHGEVRGVAAFALGVLGGDHANKRLEEMLDDGYPTARFNAVTGLARLGDARCVRGLVELLDTSNPDVIKGEGEQKHHQLKRIQVIQAALQSAIKLAEANKTDDLTKVENALDDLAESKLDGIADRGAQRRIRNAAQETKKVFVKRRS